LGFEWEWQNEESFDVHFFLQGIDADDKERPLIYFHSMP